MGKIGSPRPCRYCRKYFLNRTEKGDKPAKFALMIVCFGAVIGLASSFIDVLDHFGVPNLFEIVVNALIVFLINLLGIDIGRMNRVEISNLVTLIYFVVFTPILYCIIHTMNKRYKVIARVDPTGRFEVSFPKHCKVRITLLKRVNKYVFFNMCIRDAVFGHTYDEQEVGTATIPVAVNDIEKLDKTTANATICFIKEDEASLAFANLGQTFTLLHKNKPFATCTITEVYEQEDSEEI